MKKRIHHIAAGVSTGLLFFAGLSPGISAEKSESPLSGRKALLRDGAPVFSKSLLIPQEKPAVTLMTNRKPPSRGRAFMLSLILPGAGEYYAGSKKMAGIFAGTEAVLWGTFFTLRAYGSMLKSDYRDYAVAHAGVDLSGKEHQYFVDIEHFDNIRSYNEAKLQQRNADALYPETDEYDWQWDSKSSRLKYEKIRVSSDKAYSRSIMVVGIIVANHIISGIDAIRLVKKREDEAAETMSLDVVPRAEGGFEIAFQKQF